MAQMLLGNEKMSEKLARDYGGRNPVVAMLVRWTKTGAAFKIAVLGSMLAGPVAAAVASGTALLVGYGYVACLACGGSGAVRRFSPLENGDISRRE